MEEGKRDPFADFMNALCGHDTVILRLTGIGETAYTTQEVHEMISFRLANHKRRADAAVEDLELVCTVGESCFVCKNLEYRGDDFPCIYGEWCMGEKWQWRGPEIGE